MQQLFLGGVRSGKSQLAEAAAIASGREVVYVATADLRDREMQSRAAKHRQRRPDHWQLVEEPLALAAALREHASAGRCLLVDCLVVWLSNLLGAGEPLARDAVAALLTTFPTLPGDLVLVSGEVGLGIVPANALAREYADQLGELNQAVAQRCQRVTLAVAGLPHKLKDMEMAS